MCLERVRPSSSSKFKLAEWDEQRVKCFEVAGDLTLLYLQEQDKLQQQQQQQQITTINTGTDLCHDNNGCVMFGLSHSSLYLYKR
jgi:hypothetical protein